MHLLSQRVNTLSNALDVRETVTTNGYTSHILRTVYSTSQKQYENNNHDIPMLKIQHKGGLYTIYVLSRIDKCLAQYIKQINTE